MLSQSVNVHVNVHFSARNNNTAFHKEDLGGGAAAADSSIPAGRTGRIRSKNGGSEENTQANPMWEDGRRKKKGADGKDMRGLN